MVIDDQKQNKIFVRMKTFSLLSGKFYGEIIQLTFLVK